MKRALILISLFAILCANAHAGLTGIKSLKVVVIAAISGPNYIQENEIKQQIAESFKKAIPEIKLDDSSAYICELRYSDDYKIYVSGIMYGSYYLTIVIKSKYDSYDKIAPSSKVYWERVLFMPVLDCNSLNGSVKNNIKSFIEAFGAERKGSSGK